MTHATCIKLLACITGLICCGVVNAQGMTASIFGQGPAGATVQAQSTTGVKRQVTIKSNGRYMISPIQVGTYTVVLQKNEKTVDTRSHVSLTIGKGAEVDFACDNDQCRETKG